MQGDTDDNKKEDGVTPAQEEKSADPESTTSEPGASESGGMSLLSEPFFIESMVVLFLFLFSALFFRRLASIAREMGKRKSLREFIGGMDAYFKKDFEKAIKLLSAVVERDPENAEARICLGDAYRETGNAAEAHKHHYHVLEIFGRDLLQNHLSLARDLLALDRLPEAKDHLGRVLLEKPRHEKALALLAEVTERMGTFSESVEHRRKLIDGLSKNRSLQKERRALARVLSLAGSQRLDDGDLKRGLPLLEEAVKISPGLVRPRMEMVRARLIEGNPKGARKVFRQQFKEMKSLMDSKDFVFEPSSHGSTSFQGLGSARPEDSVIDDPRLESGGKQDPSLPPPADTKGNPLLASSDEVTSGGVDQSVQDPSAPVQPILEAPAVPSPSPVQKTPKVPTQVSDDGLLPPDVESVGEFLGEILVREAPYHCTGCGRASAEFHEQCQECGEWGTLTESDRSYLEKIQRLGDILDEVDENSAYLDRLVKRVVEGDVHAGEKLKRAGQRGCAAVLRALRSSKKPDILVTHLVGLGPHSLEDLTAAYVEVMNPDHGDGVGGALSKIRDAAVSVPGSLLEETSWLTGGKKAKDRNDTGGGKGLEGFLIQVFVGIGASGSSFYRQSVEHFNPSVRQASLVALLRFGGGDILEELPLVMPKKTIVQSLNGFSDEVLKELLRRVQPEGQFAQSVLTDRTFTRANLLIASLRDVDSAATVAGILSHRGFSPEVFDALVSAQSLGVPSERVRQVLIGFGVDASDHLVASLADGATPSAFCGVAASVLENLGPSCIPRLIENLDGKETPEERRVAQMIVSFGEEAVDELVDQYTKAGKVGLLRGRGKGQVRRGRILDLLEKIGGKRVKKLLKPLMKKETDEALRRRLETVAANAVRR